jgi:hypothetical protein
VLVGDPEACTVLEDLDLRSLDREPDPLGWCRGLHVEDGVAFVGFSCLRSTRWKENLRWLGRGHLGRRRPTRVAAFDLANRRKIAEWTLEPVGLDAIFAILPAKN